MKKHIKSISWLIIILYLPLSSCNQFLELDVPPTRLLSNAVFDNESTAKSAVAGMYINLYSGFSSSSFQPIISGLLADELIASGNNFPEVYFNSLTSTNSNVFNLWRLPYSIIYQANSIIEGLHQGNLENSIKNRLMGEALFVRAYCYFYLVNYFGEVPLILVTDVQKTARVDRTPINEVYRQITIDLEEARNLLPDNYAHYANERIRATSHAANAFLARVYLYLEDWAKAEEYASMVINQSNLYSLMEDLNEVFYKNNQEAIFQLLTFNGMGYTWIGNIFIPNSPEVIPPYILTDEIIDSFVSEDKRFATWIFSNAVNGVVYHYAYKYKQRQGMLSGPNGEYDSTLRLSEQYLIRAEAQAHIGNFELALADLNTLRQRAGIPSIGMDEVGGIMLHIEQERRRELFAEWGHRWFDLIRTNRADVVLGNIKSDWEPFDKLLPIPMQELNRNPKLYQNPGYE